MMNIERANLIAEIVANKTGLEATAQEVRKGDFKKVGIMVSEAGATIRPTIYTDIMVELTDEEIADKVIEIYQNSLGNKLEWDANEYLDYNKVRQGLRLCIRPQTENEDDVKIPYLDLELFVRYDLNLGLEHNGTITVKKDHLDKWGITPSKLISDARESMKDKWAGDDMQNVIMSMMFGGSANMKSISELIPEIKNDVDDVMPPMYVIGTFDKMWGASLLYEREIFAEIAKRFDDDVAIIPSSIHELIVTAKNRFNGDLATMIQEVNASEVSPEERLANHPYFYDRELGQITY